MTTKLYDTDFDAWAAQQTQLPLARFPEACPWPVPRVLNEDFWPDRLEPEP
jgi:hypothetical protein